MPAADQAFINGIVRTMENDRVTSEPPTAVAVAAGRITAVGTDAQIKSLVGESTEVVDLDGRALVPGFIETHLHPLMWGLLLAGVEATPRACPSIDDVVRALADRAESTPAGELIDAWGFDDSLVSDGRGLTVEDLDRASTQHPIMVRHTSNHAIYLNSAALTSAGITAETPQPDGGTIVQRADGSPTGELREEPAMSLFDGLYPPVTLDTARRALRSAQDEMARVGVTTFHDMLVTAPMLAAYRQLAADGELRLRTRLYLSDSTGAADAQETSASAGGGHSSHVAVGGVKLIADGSIQLHTAALTQPYSDDEGCGCGDLALPTADLEEAVERHHAAGRSLAIHTNGDRAIDVALDCVERSQEAHPRADVRHRLEHVQTLRDDQIERMRRLGVAASVFVNHVHYWGDRHRERFLGPDRASRISPVASIAAAGLPYGLHCDCPVTPVDPLATMDTAIRRLTCEGHLLGPQERVSPAQALAGFTREAARLSADVHDRGRIAPGLWADLVVLDADPLSMRQDDDRSPGSPGLSVLRTVVGGETVYRAKD